MNISGAPGSGPATRATVSFQCRYLPEVEVESNKFTVKPGTATSSTTGYGSLANSFSLELFEDKQYSNPITTSTMIYIGSKIYVAAKFAIKTLMGDVDFFVESCSVETVDSQAVQVAVVMGNCYSTSLGATIENINGKHKQAITAKLSYASFSTGADAMAITQQKLACKLRICILGEACSFKTTCPVKDDGYNYTLDGK